VYASNVLQQTITTVKKNAHLFNDDVCNKTFM